MANTSWADDAYYEIFTADEEVFGKTVSISRGPYTTSNVTAVVEEHVDSFAEYHPRYRKEQEESVGLENVIQQRDYIIRKSNYRINSQTVSPAHGDIIIEVVNGTTRHFVCTPINEMEAYVDDDADGVRWRIRTKEVPVL